MFCSRRNLFFLAILLCPSFASAQPTLDSALVEDQGGALRLTVSGAGFGTRETYNTSGDGFLSVAWNSFDSGVIGAGGWDFEAPLQVQKDQWSMVPGGRTGRGFSAKKIYIGNEYGGPSIVQKGTTGKWFLSFWLMVPDPTQGGKILRIYGSTSQIIMGVASGAGEKALEAQTTIPGVTKWPIYRSPQKLAGEKWSRIDVIMREHPTLDEFSVYLDGQWQYTRASAAPPGPQTRSPYNLPDYVPTLADSAPERWVANPFVGNGHTIDVATQLSSPARGYPAVGSYNIDDLYLDYSWARVEIGDASTWSACRHKEIQIPRQWSNTAISADFNPGSFKPGETVYVYVVDAEGTVGAPRPIVIPGSVAAVSPQAPVGVRISQ